ncbi:MAG TPA: DUF2127 domain-containing protein [Burkholderiales bacterium]|nr:DUF2127 domain-containing protein [Burkholderiales bacterium]
MTTPREEKALHDVFLISIWIKGVVGLMQAVAGVLLLLVTQQALTAFVLYVTTPELSEDPHDLVATFLKSSAEHWGAGTQLFASIYLIIHGVIKILLVAGLLRKKMWSYPVSLWVLGAFIIYQCYRYTLTHSPWLVLLTALDVVVVFLIFHEYRIRKALGFSMRIGHP